MTETSAPQKESPSALRSMLALVALVLASYGVYLAYRPTAPSVEELEQLLIEDNVDRIIEKLEDYAESRYTYLHTIYAMKHTGICRYRLAEAIVDKSQVIDKRASIHTQLLLTGLPCLDDEQFQDLMQKIDGDYLAWYPPIGSKLDDSKLILFCEIVKDDPRKQARLSILEYFEKTLAPDQENLESGFGRRDPNTISTCLEFLREDAEPEIREKVTNLIAQLEVTSEAG
ncbi:hypothetical protein GYB59_09795 [bacterium]|nr:hypothetical protein [bacterium]